MWDVSTLYGGYIVIITSAVAAVVTITILVCTYRRHKQLQIQNIRNKELTKTSKKKTSSPTNRRKSSRNERDEEEKGDNNNQRGSQSDGRRDSGSASNHGRKKKRKRSKAGVEKLQDQEGEDENETNDLDTMLDVDFIRGDRRESKTSTDTIHQVMRVESVHMNSESVDEVAEMKVENGDPMHNLKFSESGTHFVNSDTSDTMVLDTASSSDNKNLDKGNTLKPPKSSPEKSDRNVLDNSEVNIKTENELFQKSVGSTTNSAPTAVENEHDEKNVKPVIRHKDEIEVRQVQQTLKADPKSVSQKVAKKKGKKAPQNAIDRFKAKESAKSSSSELSDAEPVARGGGDPNSNISKKSENFVSSISVQKTKEIPLADSDTVISHEDSKAVEMCIKIPKQKESKGKKKARKSSVEALKNASNSKTSSSELSETEVPTKRQSVKDGDVTKQENGVPTVNAVESQLSVTNGHDVDNVQRVSSDEGKVLVPKSPRKGEQKAQSVGNIGQDTKDVFSQWNTPVSVVNAGVISSDGVAENGSMVGSNEKSKQPPLKQDSIRPSQDELTANGEDSEKVHELVEQFPLAARIDYRGIMDTSSDASASDTAMNKKIHDKKPKRQRNKKTGRRADKEPEQSNKGRTIVVDAPKELVAQSHRVDETLSVVATSGFVASHTESSDSKTTMKPPKFERLRFQDDDENTRNIPVKKADSTSNSENESGSETSKLSERRKSVTFSETIAEVIEIPYTPENMPENSLETEFPSLWKPENVIGEYPGNAVNNEDVTQMNEMEITTPQTNETEVFIPNRFVAEQNMEVLAPVSSIPQVSTTDETLNAAPHQGNVDAETPREDASNTVMKRKMSPEDSSIPQVSETAETPNAASYQGNNNAETPRQGNEDAGITEVKRKMSPEDMPIMFNWGGAGRILTPKSQAAKTEKPRGKKKRKGSKTDQPETSAPAEVKPKQKVSSAEPGPLEYSSHSSEIPSSAADSTPKVEDMLDVSALEKGGAPEERKTEEGEQRRNVKKFSFDWADDEEIEESPNIDASGASESDSTGYHPTWTDEDEWKRGVPQQSPQSRTSPASQTVRTIDKEGQRKQEKTQSKKNKRNDRKKPAKEHPPDRPNDEASIQPTELHTDKRKPSDPVDEPEKTAEPVSSSGKLRNLLGKKPKDNRNKQMKFEKLRPSSGSTFGNREEEIKSSTPPVESQEVPQLEEAKDEAGRPKEISAVPTEVAKVVSDSKLSVEPTVTVPLSPSGRTPNDDDRTPNVESLRESSPVDPEASKNMDTSPNTKSVTFNVDEPKSPPGETLAPTREETGPQSIDNDKPALKTKMLKNLFGKKDKKRKGKDDKKDSISSADLSHDEEPKPKKSTEIQEPVETPEAARARTLVQEPAKMTQSASEERAPENVSAKQTGKDQQLPRVDLDVSESQRSGVSGEAKKLQPEEEGQTDDAAPEKTELTCTIPQSNSSPNVDAQSTSVDDASSVQTEQMPVAEIAPVESFPENTNVMASQPEEGSDAKKERTGKDVSQETKTPTPIAVEQTRDATPRTRDASQEPKEKPLSKTKKLKKLFGGKKEKDKKQKGNKLDTEVSRLRTESTSSMVSTSSAESHDDESAAKGKGPKSERPVQSPVIPNEQPMAGVRERTGEQEQPVSSITAGIERPNEVAEIPTIAKQNAVTLAEPKPMTELVTDDISQTGPTTVSSKPESPVIKLDVDVECPVNDTKAAIMAPEATMSDTEAVKLMAESGSEAHVPSVPTIESVSVSVAPKSAEVEYATENNSTVRDAAVTEDTGTVGMSAEGIIAESVLEEVKNQGATEVNSQTQEVEKIPVGINSSLPTFSDLTETIEDSPADTQELEFTDDLKLRHEPVTAIPQLATDTDIPNEEEQQTKAPPVRPSEVENTVDAQSDVIKPVQQEDVATSSNTNVDAQPAPSEPKPSSPSVELKPVSKTKKLKSLFGKKKSKGDKDDIDKPRTVSTSSADYRSEEEPSKSHQLVNVGEAPPKIEDVILAPTEKTGEPSSTTSTSTSTLERPKDRHPLHPDARHSLSSDMPSSSSSLDSRRELTKPMTKTKKLKNLFSKKHKNDRGLLGRDRTWSTSSADSSASENVSRNPVVPRSLPVGDSRVPEEAIPEQKPSMSVEPVEDVLPTGDDEASIPTIESARAPEVSANVPSEEVTVPLEVSERPSRSTPNDPVQQVSEYVAEQTQIPEQVLKGEDTQRSDEPVLSENILNTEEVQPVLTEAPSSDDKVETERPTLGQVPVAGVTATVLDDERPKVIRPQNPPSDYLDLAEFVTKPHPTSPKEPVENASKEVKDPFKYNSLPLPEIPKDPETTPKTKKRNKLKGIFGKKKDKDVSKKAFKDELIPEPAQPKRPTIVESLILPETKNIPEDPESKEGIESAEPVMETVEEHVRKSANAETETVETGERNKPVTGVAVVADNLDLDPEPRLTEKEAVETDVAKNISDLADQFAEEAVESQSTADGPVLQPLKEMELEAAEQAYHPGETPALKNAEIEQNQNEDPPIRNPTEQLLEDSNDVAVTNQQLKEDVMEVGKVANLELKEPSYRLSLGDEAEDNKTKSLPLPKRESDGSLTPKNKKKSRLSGLFGKKKGKSEKESKSRLTIVQSLILPENNNVPDTDTDDQKTPVARQTDNEQAITPVLKTVDVCFPETKPERIEEVKTDTTKVLVTPADEVLSRQVFEPCSPGDEELVEKPESNMATPKLCDLNEQYSEQPEDFPLSDEKPDATVNEEEEKQKSIPVVNLEPEEPSYQLSSDDRAGDNKTQSLPLPKRESNESLTPKTKKKNRLSDLFGKKKDKHEKEPKSRSTIVQSLILPGTNRVSETEPEEPQPDIPIQIDDEQAILPTPHAVEECFPDMKPVQIEAVQNGDGNITVPADEVANTDMFEPCLPKEEETKMPTVTDVETPNPSDLSEEFPEQPGDVPLVDEQPGEEVAVVVEKPKPLPTEKLEPEKPAYQLMQDDIAEDIKTRSLPMPKREPEETVTPKTKKKLSGFFGKKKKPKKLPKISQQLILPASATVQEEPDSTPVVASFVAAPTSQKDFTPMIESEQTLSPVPGSANAPTKQRLLNIASEPISEEDEKQPASDAEVRGKVPDEASQEILLYNEQPDSVKPEQSPIQIPTVKLESERATYQQRHDDVAEDLKTRSLPLPKRESGESVTPKNKKKSMLKGLFGKKKPKELPQISQQLILPQTAYVEEEPTPEPKVATLVEGPSGNLDRELFTPMTESGHDMQERVNVSASEESQSKPKTLLTMLEEKETPVQNDQPTASQSEDHLPVQDTENPAMVTDRGTEVIANAEPESARHIQFKLPVVDFDREIREEMPETPELTQDTTRTVDLVPQIPIVGSEEHAPETRKLQGKFAGFLSRSKKPDDGTPDDLPATKSREEAFMPAMSTEEEDAGETFPSIKRTVRMPENSEAYMPLAAEGNVDDDSQITPAPAVSAQDDDETLIDGQAPALIVSIPAAVIPEPDEPTKVKEQIPNVPTAVELPSSVPVVTISPPPLFFSEEEVKRKKPSSWFEFDEFDDDTPIPVERSPKGVDEDPGMASVSLVTEVPATKPETPEISSRVNAEEMPKPPSQSENNDDSSPVITTVPPPLIFTETDVQPKKEKNKRKGFFGKKKKGDKESAPATPETPRQVLEPSPKPTRIEKSGSLKGSLRNLFGKKKKRPSITELIIEPETKTGSEAQPDAPSSESSFEPSLTSSGRGSLSCSGQTPKTSMSHDEQIERDAVTVSDSQATHDQIPVDSVHQKEMEEDLERVVQELVQETLKVVTAELQEIHGSRPISQTSEDSFNVSDTTHDSLPSELPNDSDYFGECDEATPVAMSPAPEFIIDDAFADLSVGEIQSIDNRKPSITSAEDIKVRNNALMPTGEEDGMDMDESASLDIEEEERATPVPTEAFVPTIHLDTTFSDTDYEVPRTNAVTDESDVVDSSFDPVTSSGHSGSERSDNEATKPQRKKSFRMRNPFKKTEKKDKSPQEKNKSNVSVDTIVERKPSRLKSLFSKKNADEPKTDSGTNTLESTKSKTKSDTLDSNASNKSEKKRSKLSFLRRRKDSKEETKPRVPVPESETDDELFKPKQEVTKQVAEAETKPEEQTLALALPLRTPDLTTYETSDDQYESDVSVMKAGFLSEHDHSGISTGTLSNISQKTLCMDFKHINTLRANYMRLYWEIKFSENLACMAVNSGTSWGYYAVVRDVGWPMKFKVGRCTYVKVVITSRDRVKCRQMGEIMRRVIVRKKTPQCRSRAKHLWRHLTRQMDTRNIGVLVFTTDDENRWGLSLPTLGQYAYTHWDNFLYFAWLA